MRKLDRKLIRDLSRMRGQAVAIGLVIAAGVATFVMSMCAYRSLHSSQQSFYRDFRFADLFSEARRVPNAMIPRLEQIPGVAALETRLVYDVSLDVPGMDELVNARLISVPPAGNSELNKVYISAGRMLEPDRTGEIVVSELFAQAHGFVAGDTVRAIINGRSQVLTIVGTGVSPEYVLQVQPGSVLPDDKRFGIFWIGEKDLEAAFDMAGAFNSVSVKLAYGSHPEAVIDDLDRLLDDHGSIGAYDRDQQVSHRYLSDELNQLRAMAVVSPAIFLSVAAFLLNMVVSRIVAQQREQIAALKAFGYSNIEVGSHYLSLAMVVTIAGTVVGTLFGFWMASGMTEMYAEFYRFPVLDFQVDPLAIGLAFLLTALAATIGTWLSVHSVIRLQPAEAMRPEPPHRYRPTLIERVLPRKIVPVEMIMIVRNVSRKPIKAGLSVLGIAAAASVMVLGNFSLDAMNYMMDFQFRKAQKQDLTVIFVEPATASVMHEMRGLQGVLDSEVMRTVATRIRFQNRSRRVAVMGLEPEPELYRLLDKQERVVRIPDFGVMLNTKLARLIGARLGDKVTIEVLEEKRPTVTVEVTALVEEYTGLNAYMDKSFLHSILKESPVASGAFLKVDSNQLEAVFREIESRPGIAGVTIKEAALESFRKTVAENILVMRSFIIFFAAVIAIGVVYNSARISLSERSRDLATMRVVGFTTQEVSTVLLGEIVLFTLIAIPLGCAMGYGMAALMAKGLDTENYRIPLVISRDTYFSAALVVLIATVCSGLVVQRRINRLDLIGVLKTWE